jgi:hypothetical protein
VIVESINLSHGFARFVAGNRQLAMMHGEAIFHLEQALRIAIEPRVQQSVLGGLPTPLGTLAGATLRQWTVWIYVHAFPSWLLAGLAWSYLFRRKDFSLMRDLTVISGFLTVATYRIFPAAPPRFILAGAPYFLQDWTHRGLEASARTASVVGFNPFASFPSVHVLWALIPMVCLVRGCRRLWVWLVALLLPLTMVLTVMATGNHYVLDSAGSLLILAISYVVARALALCRPGIVRLFGGIPPREYTGPDLPAALALALACAGGLALTSRGPNVRTLVAVAILLMVVMAVIENHRSHERGGAPATAQERAARYHYMAGLLFVAGATAATRDPGMDARICSFMWLLASASTLAAHASDRRRVFPREWSRAPSEERRAVRPHFGCR